ncbi:MAG TPA: protein translocase subunit SecF [Acidimicrobiales bacterium]|nr:protein translocase subunit SecF [Acidimicrobiales bacterium]
MTDTISGEKRSLWYRLYHGETSYDFMGQKRRWFMISGVVVLIGMVSLVGRGLNFGIDFKGGTAWEVKSRSLSVTKARSAMSAVGLREAQIQRIGGDLIRVRADIGGPAAQRQEEVAKVRTKLADVANVSESQVNINDVGPSWGKEISGKARRALIFFFLAIFAYISFRFEWKMAAAALGAVVHDIAITVGIYTVSGFEVTPATIIAFLTILGYSLYDTIVVFDKIEENTRGLAASGRLTYEDTVNLSMNQVLMRSLNTSLVAILPILSILVVGAYVLGATTLEDFGLALLIGLVTGAYSSIFIASPLLAILKEREPRYAAIRQRLATRAGGPPLTPAAAAAMSGPRASSGDGAAADWSQQTPSVTPRATGSGARRPPPRGRKRGRRR